MAKKKSGLIKKLMGFEDLKNNYIFTKKIIMEERKPYKKETFEESLDRLGVKEEDKDDFLSKKYKDLRFVSLSYYLFSFLILSLFFYNLSGVFNVFSAITIALFFYFLINGFGTSLMCFHIKNRELGLLKKFLKNYKCWIPFK